MRDKNKVRIENDAVYYKKSEPKEIVWSEPALLSQEERSLIEEMKLARKSGDQDRVEEILNILYPQQLQSPGTPPEIYVVTEPPEDLNPLFAGDVLVVDDPDYEEGHPDMVSTQGQLFIVVEGMNDLCFYIYRSYDGGATWSYYMGFCGTGADDLLDPALAVPEIDEDYLYVVYEGGDFILCTRVDLSDNSYVHKIVAENDLGVHHPRIVTDNINYPGNYWLYVVYSSGTVVAGLQDAYSVIAARSTDDGLNWGNQQTLYTPDYIGAPNPRPDIAWGGGNLYATWDRAQLSGEWDVYVSRSTTLGGSWDTPVNLTTATSKDCYDPRVAAIQDGDEVVVAYSEFWDVGDTDVWYGYSDDGGSSWNTNLCLHCPSASEEERPDLSVDPSLGDFHVTFWKNWDVMYSHAPYTSPMSWSTPEIVNDTNEASWSYYPSTVAVHWESNQAGVAWSDFRTLTYAIYFDRADWVSGPDLVIDIQPVNGTVFNPGDWIIYAVTLTNNSTSPIQVTASAYASNVSDWRLNLFGPITLTIQGQSTIGPVNLQNQVPMGAPPMTAYICAEANSVHDCYQVTIQ